MTQSTVKKPRDPQMTIRLSDVVFKRFSFKETDNVGGLGMKGYETTELSELLPDGKPMGGKLTDTCARLVNHMIDTIFNLRARVAELEAEVEQLKN